MGDLLFNFLSVPPTWNLCLNKDCTHKDTSMHYFAGQYLPANKMTGGHAAERRSAIQQ